MNFDINSLLGNSSSSTSLLDPARLIAPLMPYIIAMTIISIFIAALYVMNVVNTWRSHRATIEMRDILREMNERDKARNIVTPPSTTTRLE